MPRVVKSDVTIYRVVLCAQLWYASILIGSTIRSSNQVVSIWRGVLHLDKETRGPPEPKSLSIAFQTSHHSFEGSLFESSTQRREGSIRNRSNC